MRSFNDILTNLNTLLEADLTYSRSDFYGLAVLQNKDGKTFPMRRTSTQEGKKISPEDGRGLKFYHRVLSNTVETAGGKGSKVYYQATFNMVLVGVGYRRSITDSTAWNNEDIANEVMRVLGSNAILSGREVVLVQGRPVTDKLTVLNEEYNGNDFKHRVLDLIAFKIPYTLKFKQLTCDVFTSLNALTYSNNNQDVTSAFTTMEASLSPNGATVSYSAPNLPAGLSLNTTTGEISQSDYDSIPLGLHVFTITATGSGNYGGSVSFQVVFCKRSPTTPILRTVIWMNQNTYDGLGSYDADTQYIIDDDLADGVTQTIYTAWPT